MSLGDGSAPDLMDQALQLLSLWLSTLLTSSAWLGSATQQPQDLPEVSPMAPKVQHVKALQQPVPRLAVAGVPRESWASSRHCVPASQSAARATESEAPGAKCVRRDTQVRAFCSPFANVR